MPTSIEIWQATQEGSSQTMLRNLGNNTVANEFEEVVSHSIPKIIGDLTDYINYCILPLISHGSKISQCRLEP